MTKKNHTQINNTSKQEVAIYIVPTPIGNMEDITLRALKTLKEVDVIACEDTRTTGRLLSAHGIKASMICYNDFSTEKTRQRIFHLLDSGKNIALVSDAGTPLISDPGYKLINEAITMGYKIISLPGPSSVLVALTLSGLPTNRFLFEGFLPVKNKAKRTILKKLANIESTCIFFESANRLTDTLNAIHDEMGNRKAVVLRELTKLYEERKDGNIQELLEYYTKEGPPKGEIIILTEPAQNNNTEISDSDIIAKLKLYLKNMSLKEASALLAEESGRKKSYIYKMGIEVKGTL